MSLPNEERNMQFQKLSSIKVKHLIDRDLVWISPKAKIQEAAELLLKEDVGALCVCEEGRLLGVLSERDIVRRCVARDGFDTENNWVRQIMSAPPITLDRNMSIGIAAMVMIENGIRHLPIMQREKCIGMVSIRRIVEEYRRGLQTSILGVAAE